MVGKSLPADRKRPCALSRNVNTPDGSGRGAADAADCVQVQNAIWLPSISETYLSTPGAAGLAVAIPFAAFFMNAGNSVIGQDCRICHHLFNARFKLGVLQPGLALRGNLRRVVSFVRARSGERNGRRSELGSGALGG